MEPTLKNGDSVIVDVSQKTPETEGVYAVVMNGKILIKRIQFMRKGYRLISDNKRYDPIDLEEFDDISIVGRCYVCMATKTL